MLHHFTLREKSYIFLIAFSLFGYKKGSLTQTGAGTGALDDGVFTGVVED